ncbi:CST complex subunit STN1 isoform X21 [Canis lupus dingo]|uniref:CST complex subunit STN1 isoform X21 n=1 Tax=Canis lupus dingo TaxID=286419 RepID=UPI0020C31611|nr:CST complex subunit STN1 isoform X21 [Canis lupus dingo]
MQSESSQCEEEPPSLLWGLDPVFLAFAKLYIRDILNLKESRQVQVDDSTGVINCICWKKSNNIESSSDKVDDPVCNIQIARMLELPSIYRKVYDQPFRIPALEQESSDPGALDLANLTCLLSERAKEFLMENKVQTFYQQELEIVESLLSLANQPVIHGTSSEQNSKNDTTSKAIHSIFKNAIQLLQEKGFVFQKDHGFDKLYYVTREDKELHRKIHHIIQEDCQKPNRKEREAAPPATYQYYFPACTEDEVFKFKEPSPAQSPRRSQLTACACGFWPVPACLDLVEGKKWNHHFWE